MENSQCLWLWIAVSEVQPWQSSTITKAIETWLVRPQTLEVLAG